MNWSTAYAPDCQSIYYSTYSFTANRRRIYRFDIATGKESELLADDGFFSFPYASPDGRWLALTGNLPGKGVGLLVMPTEGGPLRMLDEYASDMGVVSGGVRWTPDSRRLLYARPAKRGEEFELYSVPVEGGTPQSMGIRMPGASAASLHPDGKRILFSSSEDMEELRVLRNLPLN